MTVLLIRSLSQYVFPAVGDVAAVGEGVVVIAQAVTVELLTPSVKLPMRPVVLSRNPSY